jgi:F420-non-reducing hydrogenase small subunit
MADKFKLSVYWASACGGCDVAIVDLCEDILKVVEVADLVFWPCALDFKYKDVEVMEDKSIDVCLFHGGIRNSENEEVAKLLRKKSKVMIAFGSCACFGGIPGLANFTNQKEIFDEAYSNTPSTDNPSNIRPKTQTDTQEGALTLPKVYDKVSTLADVVEVEYYLPGCAPPAKLILTAVEAIANNQLPPVGSTIAGDKSLCDECERKKDEKRIKKFYRTHQIVPDTEICLLEQGIICCGPATRSGCGHRCITANMPCRGCFGPVEQIHDMGAKLLSAIASIIDSKDEEEIKHIEDTIPDPAGYFYRFGLPNSMLKEII